MHCPMFSLRRAVLQTHRERSGGLLCWRQCDLLLFWHVLPSFSSFGNLGPSSFGMPLALRWLGNSLCKEFRRALSVVSYQFGSIWIYSQVVTSCVQVVARSIGATDTVPRNRHLSFDATGGFSLAISMSEEKTKSILH